MSGNRSAIYIALLIAAAAAAGYMFARSLQHGVPELASGTALPQSRPVGAFTLVDQDGKPFGQPQLPGKPSLMFFGFTHCPDVCPTTLALMAQLHRDPYLQDLRMVFVSVDPGRDDVSTMRRYVDAFGGGFTGLRGDDAQLEPLLKSLGVARALQPLPGGDYSVDHSATLFYVNEKGALSAVFTPPFDIARLRPDLLTLVSSRY
jgi:protein SCO1